MIYGTYDMTSVWRTLREYRLQLTRQQLRTIAGQIKGGHPNEAMNGLAKILNRQRGWRRVRAKANRPKIFIDP